jgi:hypothetical protein
VAKAYASTLIGVVASPAGPTRATSAVLLRTAAASVAAQGVESTEMRSVRPLRGWTTAVGLAFSTRGRGGCFFREGPGRGVPTKLFAHEGPRGTATVAARAGRQ